MSGFLLTLYVFVAIAAFVTAMRHESGLIATAIDDDALGCSMFVLGLFIMATLWPLALGLFAAAGIFYAGIRLTVWIVTR